MFPDDANPEWAKINESFAGYFIARSGSPGEAETKRIRDRVAKEMRKDGWTVWVEPRSVMGGSDTAEYSFSTMRKREAAGREMHLPRDSRDFLTLDDVLDIDNTTINTYETYKGLVYPDKKEISYGDLREVTLKSTVDNTPIDELFLMCKYLEGSDYSGDMLQKSNYKLFLEDFGKEEGVFDVCGGHGTFAVAISVGWLLDSRNDEIARQILDLLDGLNTYPAIDDEDMSNMEFKAFNEAFEDWGYKDIMSDLQKKFRVTVYDYDEDAFKEFLLEIERRGNSMWIIEEGGGVYIDVEAWIKDITLDQVKKFFKDWEQD